MIFSNVLLNVGERVIGLYEVTFLGSRLGFGMTVICDILKCFGMYAVLRIAL